MPPSRAGQCIIAGVLGQHAVHRREVEGMCRSRAVTAEGRLNTTSKV